VAPVLAAIQRADDQRAVGMVPGKQRIKRCVCGLSAECQQCCRDDEPVLHQVLLRAVTMEYKVSLIGFWRGFPASQYDKTVCNIVLLCLFSGHVAARAKK
jgi:hypothetical protein